MERICHQIFCESKDSCAQSENSQKTYYVYLVFSIFSLSEIALQTKGDEVVLFEVGAVFVNGFSHGWLSHPVSGKAQMQLRVLKTASGSYVAFPIAR